MLPLLHTPNGVLEILGIWGIKGGHVSFEKALPVIPKCSLPLSRPLTNTREPG